MTDLRQSDNLFFMTKTKAISVVVERSRGGGGGWFAKVGIGDSKFSFDRSDDGSAPLSWALGRLTELGAPFEERERVETLVTKELRSRRRVEVIAEVTI